MYMYVDEPLIFVFIQCVKSVLLNKIVSSEKDLVGVVLYGTVSTCTRIFTCTCLVHCVGVMVFEDTFILECLFMVYT